MSVWDDRILSESQFGRGTLPWPAGLREEPDDLTALGGAGSGNFGHAGRPGSVGGSAPSGRQMPLPWSTSGSAGVQTILNVGDRPFSNPPRIEGRIVPAARPGSVDAPDISPDGSATDSLTTPASVSGSSNYLGGGVNESLVIEDDEGHKYVFKPVDGERFDAREGQVDNQDAPLAEREVLAARVDRELGLGLVPNTVMAEFEGRVGSLQVFVPGEEGSYGAAEDERARMGVLDAIIGNSDRHGGNVMTAEEDGRLVAIDHGYTFGTNLDVDGRSVEEIQPGDLTAVEQAALAARLASFNWGRVLHGSHLDQSERSALRTRVQRVQERLAAGQVERLKELASSGW